MIQNNVATFINYFILLSQIVSELMNYNFYVLYLLFG